MQADRNQHDRPLAQVRDLDEVRREVMSFLRNEVGFAQVYTVNREGYPVGRTMAAPIEDDWSVTLVQRNVHHRLKQLRRNPHVEITWVGSPAPGSINDRPHVYDFGLLIPRVVFLRGLAQFMDEEEMITAYQSQTAVQRGKGLTAAPERTVPNIKAELVGVRILTRQIRVEGFGAGAESFTWTIEES